MKFRFALLMLSLAATAAQAQEDTVAETWTAKCKSCHGPDGKGQTQMGKKEAIQDLSLPSWQKSWTDARIREVIAEGSRDNKKMKAYKDKLTPQQIDALVAYVRGFQKG
ncbi:cytochrome c family protein [Cystobacter fuscus DSM 2262]|uniref:Cytochrome c family protein n=1 Tax=Cystobacter fuscus (strain ATCC 25194 / DSM 2262 / NBRC 100088 / M29) TaxID=1242864 RepID=S9QGP0_CYSF2|nr:cytochrome c [Cystobacter fuscus]EPX60484.1 cytochrome c family protein [Cystobacter fuscus DSM 2262]